MWRKLGAWYWLATHHRRPAGRCPAHDQHDRMVAVSACCRTEKIARFRELTPAQKALMLSARKEAGKFSEGVILSKSRGRARAQPREQRGGEGLAGRLEPSAGAFCVRGTGCRFHRPRMEGLSRLLCRPVGPTRGNQVCPIVRWVSSFEHLLEDGVGIGLATRRAQGLLIVDPGEHDGLRSGVVAEEQAESPTDLRAGDEPARRRHPIEPAASWIRPTRTPFTCCESPTARRAPPSSVQDILKR